LSCKTQQILSGGQPKQQEGSMLKLLNPHRFTIWLLAACLWLPACVWSAAVDNTPAVDENAAPAAAQDTSAVEQRQTAPLQEQIPDLGAGIESPPAEGAEVVLHLPLLSANDQAPTECLDPASQAMSSSIAASFETPFETVMLWYCSGYAFEDILLALQTAAQVETPAGELLVKLGQGLSWEEIWIEIGLLK
jgi:hypothetical protein